MDTKSFFSTLFIASVLMAPAALRAEAARYDFLPLLSCAADDEAAAQQPAPKQNPAPSSKPSGDSALYTEGARAIDAGQWADAESIFTKVADMHGENAEGALYWKANPPALSKPALSCAARIQKADGQASAPRSRLRFAVKARIPFSPGRSRTTN
jgi:hypothetical protein